MNASFPFSSCWLGESQDGGQAWLRALPPKSVVTLLLLEGEVNLQARPGAASSTTKAGRLIWINTATARPDRILLTGRGRHRALMLAFPDAWVRQSIADLDRELSPDMRCLLLGHTHPQPWLERPLESCDRTWAKTLSATALTGLARELLEGSRINEFFFRKVLMESSDKELFCSRTRRLALERVECVRAALERDLEFPPSLEELAEECGCNPHYLSRTFAQAAGKTISLMLRELRVRRAADLIASGSHNISEAALDVGYRSLSHFSQAFREEFGCTPSAWLQQRLPARPSAWTASPSSFSRLRNQRRRG